MEYGSFEFGDTTIEKKRETADSLELEKEKRLKEEQLEKNKKAESQKKPKKTEDSPKQEDAKKPFFEFKKKTPESEELSEEEQKHELAKEYVASKSEDLKAELATLDSNSPEATEILADLDLLTTLNEKLDDPDLEVDPAVEAAYQQIMQQLEGVFSEDEKEPKDDNLKLKNFLTDQTPSNPDDSFSPENPRSTATLHTRPPLNLSGKTTATDADVPAAEGIDQSPSRNTSTSESGGGYTNNTEAPETPKKNEESAKPEYKMRRRSAASLLVAGAVGTMLERGSNEKRSNFIETTTSREREAQPNPVRSIEEKERAVRKMALSQIIESPRSKTTENRRPPLNVREYEPERNGTLQPTTKESTTNKLPNLEKPIYLEEIKPSVTTDQPEATETNQKKLSKEMSRNVEQSSTQELLRIANDIHVDGTTVRRLYESNQIDHRGLVSIVKEALRGGNIKKAYGRAKLGHEAQIGRKIEMRHDDPSFVGQDISPAPLATQKRTESIIKELHRVQARTAPTQTTESSNTTSIADLSYKQVQNAMKKKRIATLTISTALALSSAGAIAWLIFG